MKARYAFVVGIAALAIGILIGRWAGRDSLNGEEPGKPSGQQEVSADSTPPVPSPDVDRKRLLAETSALYLHLDLPRLTAEADRYRLAEFLRRPEASEIVAAFFEQSRPALINAVTQTLSYGGSELDLALVPKNVESGEGEPQLIISGKVEDATRDLGAFLGVGIAPWLAGGAVSTSTEELMGLPFLTASGPKGGLFWVHRDGQFIAARAKEVLAELLKPKTESPEVEGASEAVSAGGWGDEPITFHLDLERAQKSGILPKSPDPSAPLVVSALALAGAKGFESLEVSGGYQGAVLDFSLKLTHKEELPPVWRSLRLGTDIYERLPVDTWAALAAPFPGELPHDIAEDVGHEESAGADENVVEATPVQLRLLERVLPGKKELLRPVLTPSGGTLIVGVCPIEAVPGAPEYFLSLPYPGDEATEGILAWAREAGATVESVAFFGMTVYDLDFGDSAILGAAELARVVVARVGDSLVVATHPDLLRKLEPDVLKDGLAQVEEYSALTAALIPTAAIRGYLAGDFLQAILQGHRDRLDLSQPGAEGIDQILKTAAAFSAPIYVSLSAEGRTLELRVRSSSDVAAIAAAGLLHHAAARFLIEG